MKDGKTQTQVAQLMDRYKSTISRGLARNTGNRGSRARQACLLTEERSLGSRNATQITIAEWSKTVDCLLGNWSPVQIANHAGISHETIYRHIYADKAASGSLYQQLHCQKKRKERYASGRERRGQIIGRRPISERPARIEIRAKVGQSECDTVIGALHKQGVLTLVERKSGYAVLSKVIKKTADLFSSAIINKLVPMDPLVKTITFDNGKEFAEHQPIDATLKSTTYFDDPFAS